MKETNPNTTQSARFASIVFNRLLPHFDIVDLGAGSNGSDTGATALFARRVDRSTAVDTMARPTQLPRNVEWYQGRIEDWLQEQVSFPLEQPNAYILRNVLHFLQRDWVLFTLLPMLGKTLAPGGFVAISTFHAHPTPRVHPAYPSLYSLADLRNRFPPAWAEHLSVEETLRGPSSEDPTVRDWHTTQLVIGNSS